MRLKYAGLVVSVLVVGLVLFGGSGIAQADQVNQDDDLVERGEYVASISGCVGCHTPIDENFQPIREKLYAGGYPFDLGPLGVVLTRNITPDPETGIGNWTDREIETAIRTGVTPDGLRIAPVMPYVFFNQMADEDMEALIAYLRSVEPVENVIPRQQTVPSELVPDLPMPSGPITAPDPSDTEARAQYLFTAIMACTDCHTPLDPETGLPDENLYLSGSQPFEGPWGIVYGGNITPHAMDDWTDQDIERVLRTGIRPDGRQVVLMPWPDYAVLTDEDMEATLYYLRNDVPSVDRTVPAAALNPEWEVYVEVPQDDAGGTLSLTTAMIIGGVVGLVLAAGAYFWFRQRNQTA